jgi:hypothetical protein
MGRENRLEKSGEIATQTLKTYSPNERGDKRDLADNFSGSNEVEQMHVEIGRAHSHDKNC